MNIKKQIENKINEYKNSKPPLNYIYIPIESIERKYKKLLEYYNKYNVGDYIINSFNSKYVVVFKSNDKVIYINEILPSGSLSTITNTINTEDNYKLDEEYISSKIIGDEFIPNKKEKQETKKQRQMLKEIKKYRIFDDNYNRWGCTKDNFQQLKKVKCIYIPIIKGSYYGKTIKYKDIIKWEKVRVEIEGDNRINFINDNEEIVGYHRMGSHILKHLTTKPIEI